MTAERWQRVKELVAACLETAPGERSGYLERHCAGDAELRREVESLVASYEDSGDLLEAPALAPPAADQPVAGRRVGPYVLESELGEGGMARVFLASDSNDPSRKVALKLIKRGMDFDFVLRRFRQERQILASLDHPNVARLLDAGSTTDGIPYFVMEYVRGLAIDRYCDAARLSVPERLTLFRTVCSAVAYAHGRRIIHRDIKPANVLVTPEGVPKLLDFGIAKTLEPRQWTLTIEETATVLRLMTPEYASPEQIRGETLSESTDVYSLGVLLFELLTGRRPYRLETRAPHELARAICEDAPARPSSTVLRREEIARLPGGAPVVVTPEQVSSERRTVPRRLRRELAGGLDNVVLMAIRKEPQRRYASVVEFSEDIGRYLENVPVLARGDSPWYRARRTIGQNRKTALAALVSVPVLSAALATALLVRPAPPAMFASATAPRITPFTTMPGNEWQPAFSPDGRNLAFVWAGEDGTNPSVYVKSVAGGAPRRVAPDAAADTSPAWSPDGRSIAFLRNRGASAAVWVAPVSGGPGSMLAAVTPNRVEAVGRQLAWAPEGAHLAVADRESPSAPFSIFLVSLNGGRKTKLTFPPAKNIGDTSPAFSRDGAYISFLRAPSSGITELWDARGDGSRARQLTSDGRSITAQAWTPDGRGIVFSSDRGVGLRLWWVPRAGGEPRRVPGAAENVGDPAIAGDGRSLAYAQSFVDTNVWRVDLSGGSASPPREVVASTQYDTSPAFAPDGKRIAFRSNRSGYNEIWTSDPDGGGGAQLTHFDGPLTGSPCWSPDGKWIAFDSRPAGQADVYVVAAAGGAPRRVTFESAEDVTPTWSHDGKWIYFASNRSGAWQVWKAPFDAGPKVQVTRNGGFLAFESADGRYLYYARSRSLPGLWRVPVAGGAETPVLERLKPGFWGDWALGREGIYFVDSPSPGGENARIYYYRFSDGAVREVAGIEKRVVPGDPALALEPGERSLMYAQVDQSGSDIMLAEMEAR